MHFVGGDRIGLGSIFDEEHIEVFERFNGDGLAILIPERLPGLLVDPGLDPGLLVEPFEFVSGPRLFLGVLSLMDDNVLSVIIILLLPGV